MVRLSVAAGFGFSRRQRSFLIGLSGLFCALQSAGTTRVSLSLLERSAPARRDWRGRQEACWFIRKIGAGLLVIIEPADVLPVAVGLEREDLLARVLDREQQVGHVELAARPESSRGSAGK